MKCPQEANPHRQKVYQWLPWTGGMGEWGLLHMGSGFLFWNDKMFCNCIVVTIEQFYEYTKNHQIVHVRRMNFMIFFFDFPFRILYEFSF